MRDLQELIHRLEVGGGMRHLRTGLTVVALLLLTVGYNFRAYRNMATQEAMDAAQLGRNLAEGKGYTTLFIRPFSIYLLKQRAREFKTSDPGRLKEMHPDLANPPVYPFLLAGLMKVLPFRYPVDTTHAFWSAPNFRISGGRLFFRYEPDFLIALFNELLFFTVILLVFFLARRLFDAAVAWLSAILVLGTELFWRLSVSGLSTSLLMLIFMALVWCLVLLEQEGRAPKWGRAGLVSLAAITGVVLGLGALTRYAFGWLVVPALVFAVLFAGPRRAMATAIIFAAFAAVLAPWLVRNYNLSGVPFGTASYVLLEGTVFQEHHLQRSLQPDLGGLSIFAIWLKFLGNTRQILQTDLPKLGGSWTTAFFLVGLLIAFRNPAVKRVRYFLLGTIVVLAMAQALGRTQLSEDSPEINSENLLVLMAPLVLIYGVSLFYLLLEQMELPFPQLRYLVIGLFSVGACLPMVFVFLLPRANPLSYPPYYPPAVQSVAGWVKEKQLAMSDIPWAMAWYGQRQCVWLTLQAMPDVKDPHAREDFFAINDYLKPIAALYLTPQTMNDRLLSQIIRAGELSWGRFILDNLLSKQPPPDFPLHTRRPGWLPEQLVLTE